MAKDKQNPTLQQIEMFAIQSPCIGVCEANDKGYCKGCMRSREERLYWGSVDDATKRVIIQACKRRKRKARSAAKKSAPVIQRQQDLFN